MPRLEDDWDTFKELTDELEFKRIDAYLRVKEDRRKDNESRRSVLSNPLIVGIVAALLGFLTNLVQENSRKNSEAELERQKSKETLLIEQQKQQSTTLTALIKGDDKRAILTNLEFYNKLGLIKIDNALLTQLKDDLDRVPSISVATPSADLGPAPRIAEVEGDCTNNVVARLAPSDKVRGFDMSHFTSGVSWSQAKDLKLAFVIMRASQGANNIDPKFTEFWQAAGQAGLSRSAYHFFTSIDGLSQARNFVGRFADLKLGPCDLPPVLDLEPASNTGKLEIGEVLKWLDYVEASFGRRPIVYTTKDSLERLGIDPQKLTGYPLWIPSYRKADRPRATTPWPDYVIWQFDSSLQAVGMDGNSGDADVFNGTPADFIKLTRPTPLSHPAIAAQ